MEQIVEITEKAIDQMSKIISSSEEKQAVRLKVVGGGCSGLSYKIDFDREQEKDFTQEYGEVLVVIDPKSSIYLSGVRLDFQDGLNGKGFIFSNPNATNTCGCGESFSL